MFMRNWPFMCGLLKDPGTSQMKPDQVDIAPLPLADEADQSFSGLGGWKFMVNAASENKLDQVWTFIEYMSAPEQQRIFALESTRLPTLSSLYEDEEVLNKLPVAESGREALENARPRPVSPYSPPCLALLLGHVARDGRTAQRLAQGRGSRRAGAGEPSRRASEHSG
jgi:multiple sugar transport system substrate-binding protein